MSGIVKELLEDAPFCPSYQLFGGIQNAGRFAHQFWKPEPARETSDETKTIKII